MHRTLKLLLIPALLLILALVACGQQQPAATQQPCPTAAPCPDCPACPTPEVEELIGAPYADLWRASGHADAAAAAFTHWNTADPQEIPTYCAKCHSSTGFLDYIGADGSTAFMVDANQPVGSVITCTTCHNGTTEMLDKVIFPSGVEIMAEGGDAVCMTCHQGMASMVQVDEAIAKLNLTDEDAPSAELGFTNPHYYAAAITRYGKFTMGGYQYPGKMYDGLFDHVAGFSGCTDCHDPHSLELKAEMCGSCHPGVATAGAARDIRSAASLVDYDGDGDIAEGTYYEIVGIQEKLYAAIRSYADNVVGTPIIYDIHAYPYFFIDTNANSEVDEGEAIYPNRYTSWTPRLLKAAYNYQMSLKDPGAYAHGGKYIIELLYDSLEDLNTKLDKPIDMTGMVRTDAGHFDGSGEAFRHWDAAGEVPGSCVKCHTGMGLPQFLKNGTNIAMEPSNGLLCETCHNDLVTWTRYEQKEVTFPSGKKLAFEDLDNNLCLNCHAGLESKKSVDNALAAFTDPDAPSDKIAFRNIHYFAAAVSLFGSDAQGMYEYNGKQYVGKFVHPNGLDTCTACHDAHALTAATKTCEGCHGSLETLRGMGEAVDYDGDGDVAEGLKGEIATRIEQLYAALQKYAVEVAGTAIIYDAHAYPYFFVDTNANGAVDPGEAIFPNRYASWTPRMLKAAYNFQAAQKDPGAYIHNAKYVLQVLFDSLEDLKAKVNIELPGVRP